MRSPEPRPYNSAVLVDRGELLGAYRKTHLWDREKLIFTPGDERPPVLRTRIGIGLLICYDLEFPELVVISALRGPPDHRAGQLAANAVPPGERPVEVTKALAAAATNRVVIAVADRCGVERGEAWFGASLICGLEGYLRAGPAAGEETLLVADIDLGECRDKARRPVQRRVSRPATGAVRRRFLGRADVDQPADLVDAVSPGCRSGRTRSCPRPGPPAYGRSTG